MPDDPSSSDDIAPLLRMGLDEPGSGGEPTMILTGAPAPRVAAEEGAQPGDMIGPYELLAVLGEGGFGIVWQARQREPILREVALKVIKPGMDSREIIARFEGERQALALMDHPHIAAVLDAGKTPGGRPYFAMELVKGAPLTEHCDANRLTLRQRLELFIPVCHAVQHAHQKGVLHRDLKPSNILVEMVDGCAVPKVIDFGIAKALQSGEGTEGLSLLRTQGLSIIGTPLYMSPEQAGLGGLDVDSRSDIYSLGVVLYELLTGSTPLSKETVKKAAADEVLRLIREQDAPSLERCLLSSGAQTALIATQRQTEARKLATQVRGDLEWIVVKALEKDRERRYASAAALAEDISRHLRDEPVSTGPPGMGYRLGKMARRHKGALAAAALVLGSLVLGLGLTIWQAVRATRAERVAEARLDEAQAARGTAESIINDMLHELGRELRPIGKLELLDQISRTAEDYFARLPPEQRTRAALLNQCAAWQARSEVLDDQGRVAEARQAAEQHLALAGQLIAQDPANRQLRMNMAESYKQLAKVLSSASEDDLPALRARHAINERLASEQPDDKDLQLDLASSHRGIAWALRNRDDTPAALPHVREAAAIEERLLQKEPDDDVVLGRIVISYTMTGSILRQPKTRDSPGALAADRKALEYTERQARRNPDDMQLQHGLGVCHEKVAWDLLTLGDKAGMMEHRKMQLGIMRRLVQHDPGNLSWLDSLVYAHWHMGSAHGVMDNKAARLESFRAGLEVAERLVTRAPGNVDWQASYTRMLGLTCGALAELNDEPAALVKRQQAAQFMTSLAEEGLSWKPEIAANHFGIGTLLERRKDWPAAAKEHRAAYEIQSAWLSANSDDAEGQTQRATYGWCLYRALLFQAAGLLDAAKAAEATALTQEALSHATVLTPTENDPDRLERMAQVLESIAGKLRRQTPADGINTEYDRVLALMRQQRDQARAKPK